MCRRRGLGKKCSGKQGESAAHSNGGNGNKHGKSASNNSWQTGKASWSAGKSAGSSWDQSGKSSEKVGKDESHIECWRCGKTRHYVSSCPVKDASGEGPGSASSGSSTQHRSVVEHCGSSQRSPEVRAGRGRDVVKVFWALLHDLALGHGDFTHDFGLRHVGLDDLGDARHADHNKEVAKLFEAVDWSGGGVER